MRVSDNEPPISVRLPADVNRPDRVVGGMTWRQLVIAAVTGLLIYGAWSALATVVPPLVFAVCALPVAAAGFLLAVARRDGQDLDRWLAVALRFRRQPHRLVPADGGEVVAAPAWVATTAGRPEVPAPLRLPAKAIRTDGLVDLGADGTAGLITATPVPFGLRSTAEQNALIGRYGAWLNSLDGPTQILVRSHRIDLAALADRVAEGAPALPHPALEAAAVSHAEFLDALTIDRQLLARHITVTVRDKRGPTVTARRTAAAARGLTGCEVRATITDPAAVLAACLTPENGAP
ncbi:hypothetical protein GCM10010124_40680 [Pilimelia terevasa]|uniref:PrgI family protein n=1 Tax=Pilimelia terevasa TaxID=53372 RepID=A0A8J3FJX6_9ACTN|nr:PrgI family protein [Pilimelia terevasa]GGK43759.1 hypothetical protein GCM10010124_40680 [Pilimelia terevasa]